MKFKIQAGIFQLHFLAILLLSLAPAAADPVVTCTPPASGIVDWWQAESNTVNVIDSAFGTLYSGTSYTNGVVGQAFSFDGIAGCVMNTNTPSLTNIQDNFTMEFWAYPQKAFNLLPEGETNANGISGQSYAIFPDWGGDAGAGAGVCVGSNGISVMSHGGNYLPSLLSYSSVITGWVHVAVVFTNKQPTLYLNGVNVRTGVASTRAYVYPSKSLGNSYVPGFFFENYGPYQGFLDEIAIYNRALGADEIQAIYAAGSAGKCTTGFPPVFTQVPAPQSSNPGTSVTFTAAAAGPAPLSFQWSFGGANITDATNSSLTLTNLQPANEGVYTVVVNNPYGSATNSGAVLTVFQPPYIVSQPLGQVVAPLSQVTFSVIAFGPNLKYQWQFKNVNISKATNATYVLASAAINSAGNYRVIVSNKYASIVSSNALLNVLHPAFATAVVVDGFVVSNTVTDGGSGYTNIPSVKIVNGGGSGAQAVAVVSNGVVVGITILNAGSGYTSTPQVIIEPAIIPNPVLATVRATLLSFSGMKSSTNTGTNAIVYQLQKAQGWYWTNMPTVLTNATNYSQIVNGIVGGSSYRLALLPLNNQAFANAILSHGFVVSNTITKGGSGYSSSNAPLVQIVGGGGSNAKAVAYVSTNGVVTNIVITSAGIGYTNVPAIQIDPPPATAVSPTALAGMQLTATNLLPYEYYVTQISDKPTTGWGDWIINNSYTSYSFSTQAGTFQFVPTTNTANYFRLRYAP